MSRNTNRSKVRGAGRVSPQINSYNFTPRQHCHKCGKHQWSAESTPLTWSCNTCGNLSYFTLGSFKQQIDYIMQSHRGEDYVRSVDGKCIMPKKNEELRRIRFRDKIEAEESV